MWTGRLTIPLFDHLSVSDATVIYRDQRDGLGSRLHLVSLTHRSDEASGAMQLAAQGDIDGRALRIQGKAGNLEDAVAATDPYPLELEIRLPSIEARLAGTVGDAARATGLDLRLEVRSPSLLAATQAWNVMVPTDAEITLEASLGGDLAALSIADLRAEMRSAGGDRLELRGELGDVWSGSGLAGRLTMTLDPAGPFGMARFPGWRIPSRIEAAANIAGTVRHPMLEEISANVQGPGGSRLNLAGSLGLDTTAGARLDSLDLTSTLQVPDPAVFGDRLGLDPSKLGALGGEVELTLADRRIEARRLRIDVSDLGDLHVEGGGRIGIVAADGTFHLAPDIALAVEMRKSRPLLRRFDPNAPELGPLRGTGRLLGGDQGYRLDALELDLGTVDGLTVSAQGSVGPLLLDDARATALDLSLRFGWPSSKVLGPLVDFELPELGRVVGEFGLSGTPAGLRIDGARFQTTGSAGVAVTATGEIGDVLTLENVELHGDFEIPTTTLLAFVGMHSGSDVGRLQGRFHLSDADGSIGIELLDTGIRGTDLLALTMDGRIGDLENLDQLRFQTSLEVPSIAELAEMFDASDVGLGPLRFDGELSGNSRRLDARGRADLGDTHFEGIFGGDFTGPRPRFDARLHSPRVRLVDLGLTLGASVDSAVPDQVTVSAEPQLFGGEPLLLEGLRRLDLDLEVQFDSVEGIALDVDQAEAKVTLTDGRLQLSRLRFDVVGGYAEVAAEIDARAPTPKWRLQAVTDDLQLGDVWRQLGTEVPVSGELDLFLDLQASGNSPRDLASSLAGELSIALQRGQLRSRLFYLTTMNPLRWLTARSTRRGYASIDCFVARFQANDGFAELLTLVLDTPNVIAGGEGHIDFARETLDLRIRPRAKRSRLVELPTPFVITGSLANPVVAASAAGATARALGRVVVSPVNLLGMLLPFVNDRGRDQDNPCLTLTTSVP